MKQDLGGSQAVSVKSLEGGLLLIIVKCTRLIMGYLCVDYNKEDAVITHIRLQALPEFCVDTISGGGFHSAAGLVQELYYQAAAKVGSHLPFCVSYSLVSRCFVPSGIGCSQCIINNSNSFIHMSY